MENGLKLFEDLSERRTTFTEFLYKFMELPTAEQDRLLATQPQTANTKAARHAPALAEASGIPGRLSPGAPGSVRSGHGAFTTGVRRGGFDSPQSHG